MKWKKLPSWVKGGIIGGIIGIIPLIYVVIWLVILKNSTLSDIVLFPVNLVDNLLSTFLYSGGDMGGIIVLFIAPIFYFLIGALIGFIVGKLKKK